MIQVLGALDYAHGREVIHRDLKPENALLENRGDTPRVRLLDFGIAIVDRLDANHALTATGSYIGTPMYMAPEQLQGEQPSAAVDVYASGLVLGTLITGRPPFGGALRQLMAQKLSPQLAEGLVLSARTAPVPSPAVCAFIAACTRQDPLRRPTAAEALAELQRLLSLTPIG
jgi:serine/threonine-protein kinase